MDPIVFNHEERCLRQNLALDTDSSGDYSDSEDNYEPTDGIITPSPPTSETSEHASDPANASLIGDGQALNTVDVGSILDSNNIVSKEGDALATSNEAAALTWASLIAEQGVVFGPVLHPSFQELLHAIKDNPTARIRCMSAKSNVLDNRYTHNHEVRFVLEMETSNVGTFNEITITDNDLPLAFMPELVNVYGAIFVYFHNTRKYFQPKTRLLLSHKSAWKDNEFLTGLLPHTGRTGPMVKAPF